VESNQLNDITNMSTAYLNYSDDESEPARTTGRGRDGKREKRLERNRESARKCRRKRKAYVGDLEGKCKGLEDENAMLQLENDRLHELIQQLQSGIPEAKRAKSEFGVMMANDFSESAAHATPSLQLEIFLLLLALMTTQLFQASATLTVMMPCLMTHSSVIQATLQQAKENLNSPTSDPMSSPPRVSMVS
jgi:hypothetical protein